MSSKRGFASDNNAGIHPEILKAIESANLGHSIGYGDDPWCREAVSLFKKEFGENTEVFFVLTGTGANIVGLKSLLRSFNSVLCSATSHIHTDECGAPENFCGSKVIPIHTTDGKIYPDQLEEHLHGFGFEHHSQPGLVSITQSSEMGTIYQPEEIKTLAQITHHHQMYLHMDGARISNAAVTLGMNFHQFTIDAGVDVLSFGGTKNGLMIGEAVLFFNPELARYTRYFRKQAAQLYSKMRFIGAQFIPFLRERIWERNAIHANKMAQLLESKIKNIPGIQITQKVEANGVFALVPHKIIPLLQEQFFFYIWDEFKGEVRWMTSFDTTEEDILSFSELIEDLITNYK